MTQHYGEHNSHDEWIVIMHGMSNKHYKMIGEKVDKIYLVDINDDEAELMTKEGMEAFDKVVMDALSDFMKTIK